MLSKQEKMKVTAMRVKGKDYTFIADKLSLSLNAVRGYCYRNGLNDYKSFSQCVFCGRPIEQKHRGGKKIFCDNKCRAKWRRKAGIFVDPVYQHICKGCGKEFETNGNKKQQYCSLDCYYKTKKERNRYDDQTTENAGNCTETTGKEICGDRKNPFSQFGSSQRLL